MSDLNTRKEEIRGRVDSALATVRDLEEERRGLNAARAEADEKDRAEYTEAHGEFIEQHRAGEPRHAPPLTTRHRAKVEMRVQEIPIEIEKAELEAERPRLELVRLERGEALRAQEFPREQVGRIDEEIAKLQEERQGWQDELVGAQRREAELQSEEARLDQEVHKLEQGLKARTRVSPLFGQMIG